MPNALYILIFVAVSAACGAFMPTLIQRVEARKAEARGKEAPYEEWPRWRTLAIIASCVACSLLCLLVFGPLQAAIASVTLFVAVSCVVIDLDMRLIPNEFVLAIGGLGLALRLSGGLESLLGGVASMAAAFVFLALSLLASKALRGKPGMGAGDFKLLVVASLAVGWPGVLVMVVGYSLGVVAMSAYQLLHLRLGLKSTFPMAPAIVAGLACGLLYPAIPFLSGLAAW